MDYGQALQALKQGKRVQRAGWNGANMWVVMLVPGKNLPTQYTFDEPFKMQPCLALKTAQGTMQPGWLASQADMLAEDWGILTT